MKAYKTKKEKSISFIRILERISLLISISFFLLTLPIGGDFACYSLVLYGIRLLAEQFLGTVLDIEVDQSDMYMRVKIYLLIYV